MKATLTILTLLITAITSLPRQGLAQYAWVPVYADEVPAGGLSDYSTQASAIELAEDFASYGGDMGSEGSKGGKGGDSKCGSNCPCPLCMQRVWRSRAFVGVEFLQWWNKGRTLPPLVTSGNPAVTPFANAGVLPNAPIVFGNEEVGDDLQAGARLTGGLWLDDCRTSAVVVRGFANEGDNTTFAESSFGGPILGIPFFDVSVATPGENALVVAYANGLTPNVDAQGSVLSQASNDVFGGDVYFRTLADEGCDYRLDLLGGYQYTRIDDDLLLSTSFTRFDLAGDPQFATLDLFDVENEYNAGTLGFLGEYYRGPVSIQALAKIGIGNMRQRVAINGANRVISGGVTNVDSGGIFAQSQAPNGGPTFNIGAYERDLLVWSPEASIKAVWCATECLQISVGYTFQYWTRVALAGDQIDEAVNRDVLFGGNYLPNGGDDPRFAFRDTDFWVQTIDIGVLLNY